MQQLSTRLTVVVLVAVGILGALVGAMSYAIFDQDSSNGKAGVLSQSPSLITSGNSGGEQETIDAGQIYEQAKSSVVEVTVTNSDGQTSQGSGYVFDNDGHVITNQHVVDGADSVSLTLADGSSRKATVVGSDKSTDVAVLETSSDDLKALPTGDSSAVKVGDPVAAIGSPLGLENTLTTGIVSAIHREITAPNNFTINDAIQTDAAITHGSSGGPLINAKTQVVGITSQIDSDSGGNVGIGFAVPVNTVNSVARQIISTGKAQHAYLGVGITTIPASVSKQIKVAVGVEITDVRAGSPAAKAELKGATGTRSANGQAYPVGGDVIVALDGKETLTAEKLQSKISAMKPGDTVTVTYVRAGKKHDVKVKLTTRPS